MGIRKEGRLNAHEMKWKSVSHIHWIFGSSSSLAVIAAPQQQRSKCDGLSFNYAPLIDPLCCCNKLGMCENEHTARHQPTADTRTVLFRYSKKWRNGSCLHRQQILDQSIRIRTYSIFWERQRQWAGWGQNSSLCLMKVMLDLKVLELEKTNGC